MKSQRKQKGFTLVELAIVLVIIGLIVGGVLVGQDMIKAAELRAAVGQLEKLDTAVNVFRNKFNGLPGDLANATNFGLEGSASGTNNNNGSIDATAIGAAADFDQERAIFFSQLSATKLISDSLSVLAASTADGSVSTTMGDIFPLSKLGKGIYIMAGTVSGVSYYLMDNATIAASGSLTAGRTALSPNIAYNVDSKYDDGVPTTGKVLAVIDLAGATTSLASTTYCYDSNVYNANPTVGDTGKCSLRIRSSF